MSHTKVKSLSLKNGKLCGVFAESNVRPLYWFESEYAKEQPLEEKLKSFFKSCLQGNLQLYRNCKWSGLVDEIVELQPPHLFQGLLDYGICEPYNEAEEILSEYAMRKALKQKTNVAQVKQQLSDLVAKLDAMIWEQKEEFAKNKIVRAKWASQSDYLRCAGDKVVIIGTLDENVYISPKGTYEMPLLKMTANTVCFTNMSRKVLGLVERIGDYNKAYLNDETINNEYQDVLARLKESGIE